MGVVYRAHDEVLHRDGGSKVRRKNRNAKSAKHAKKNNMHLGQSPDPILPPVLLDGFWLPAGCRRVTKSRSN
jgi:hypothetical protein